MKTAPRDGSRILLLTPTGKQIGFWSDAIPGYSYTDYATSGWTTGEIVTWFDMDAEEDDEGIAEILPSPTHWLPLNEGEG
jgi:hypothetical protein